MRSTSASYVAGVSGGSERPKPGQSAAMTWCHRQALVPAASRMPLRIAVQVAAEVRPAGSHGVQIHIVQNSIKFAM